MDTKSENKNGYHCGSMSQSIDCYAEGDSRVVEIEGVQVTIRCLGRKAIMAHEGPKFESNK
jgi:hypothetical protein